MESEVVSTPRAAEILGVSRQHMASLADRGRVPSWRVGRHRRFRKRDLLLYKLGRTNTTVGLAQGALNVTDLRSWIYGVLISSRLESNRQSIIRIARKNLARQGMVHGEGPTRTLTTQWERLLSGPKSELQRALVSTSANSIELRHASPFAGVLTDSERQWVIRATRVS